ncbi:MAG: translation initiation factor [Synergistes sp.]|nr:translation initiation factor [Synergistes sp.]
MREKKNKKLTGGEGFTLSQEAPLSASLASLSGLSVGESAEKNAKKTDLSGKGEKSGAAGHVRQNADGELKISKIALRRERAGRGGKTVTIVIFPKDYGGDVVSLARDLRKSLGCGSSMEEGNIVLQGDLVERAAEWFAKKGVKNVSKSGK